MTLLEDAANAGNKNLLHQQIEETKGDDQPQQLRRIGRRIEGRERPGGMGALVGNTGFRVHFARRRGARRFMRLSGFRRSLRKCRSHEHHHLQVGYQMRRITAHRSGGRDP